MVTRMSAFLASSVLGLIARPVPLPSSAPVARKNHAARKNRSCNRRAGGTQSPCRRSWRRPTGTPTVGGTGRTACASAIAAMRSASSGGNGAERPAFMSTWTRICSAVASVSPARLVGHGVEDVQALGIVVEDAEGQRERVADAGLASVVNAGLERVDRRSRGAIGLVDADIAEEAVGGVAEDQQEGALGHVVVVVGPGLDHRRAVKGERRRDGRAAGPSP